jgi:hypothetical protein
MHFRLLIAISVASTLLSGASSAFAQQVYHSREDFHNNTDYGTLAFNEGALNQFQNRYEFRNFTILSDGHVNLPRQSAYCFLLNHYNSPHPTQDYTYTFNIARWFADGTPAGDDSFSNTYQPTNQPASFLYPDYCPRSISNWGRVVIQTSSSEGQEFKHQITFDRAR